MICLNTIVADSWQITLEGCLETGAVGTSVDSAANKSVQEALDTHLFAKEHCPTWKRHL